MTNEKSGLISKQIGEWVKQPGEEMITGDRMSEFFKANDEEEGVEVSKGFFFISPNRSNLFMALSKAQGEIDAAVKTNENTYFTSKYADIHDIGQAVKGPLAKNDLFYSQLWMKGDSPKEVLIVTLVGHKSGEYLQTESSMQCKEYDNPQKMGSIISYAKRYALSGILGVTSTEKRLDDDANVVTMTEVSDPKTLLKLKGAASSGAKSLTSAWKNLRVEDRKKISPADISSLKSEAKKNEPSTTKPGMVQGEGVPTNGE
jgi:hypothetical protein